MKYFCGSNIFGVISKYFPYLPFWTHCICQWCTTFVLQVWLSTFLNVPMHLTSKYTSDVYAPLLTLVFSLTYIHYLHPFHYHHLQLYRWHFHYEWVVSIKSDKNLTWFWRQAHESIWINRKLQLINMINKYVTGDN